MRPMPFSFWKSGLFVPTTIPLLPLSLSLGAGDSLEMTSAVANTPVKWNGRASTGTSGTNVAYLALNPLYGGDGSGNFREGFLDELRTLKAGFAVPGSTLAAYKSDLTGIRAANRILAATDSVTVDPAKYTIWMLFKINQALVGESPIMIVLGDGGGRFSLFTNPNTYTRHQIWFNTGNISQNVGATVGTWAVLWARFTASGNIQIAINDGAWQSAVSGISSFPNGMTQQFLFGQCNSGNPMEIADIGVMPNYEISGPDRSGVMADLRGLYPSAGI